MLIRLSVDTYTAQATAHDVKKGLANHKVSEFCEVIAALLTVLWKNLESSDTALLVFGNGDGGGGPLSKMLENVCTTHFSHYLTYSYLVISSVASKRLLTTIPNFLRSTWVIRWMNFSMILKRTRRRANYYLTGGSINVQTYLGFLVLDSRHGELYLEVRFSF
jgi:hypothetical protein